MSGGGGSGETFFGADAMAAIGADSQSVRSAGGQSACEALRFPARLRSVDPDEADNIEVGDRLVVVLTDIAPRSIQVVRELPGGMLADTPVGVLLNRLGELLPCLDVFDYVAVVTEVSGGRVNVRVEPAGPAH